MIASISHPSPGNVRCVRRVQVVSLPSQSDDHLTAHGVAHARPLVGGVSFLPILAPPRLCSPILLAPGQSHQTEQEH